MTTAAECQNCGAALAGAYCSACGQKADVSIPSVGQLLADAVGDLFNFDSRIWRSLVTLALKPGRLTRSYLEGQRARYAPPFRMYLVTSVAFFLVFSLVGFAGAPRGTEPGSAPAAETAAPAPPSPEAAAVTANADEGFGITVDRGNWRCGVDKDMGPELRARFEAACRRLVADGGASYSRALGDNIPVMMLVFIPVAAAIMNVLYLFARRKYIEHLVFFVHLHTLFFLVALVTLLTGRSAFLVPALQWPARIVGYVAWTYLLIYVYLAMRYVYRQGYALTTVKYVVLGGVYTGALLTTFLGVIVYTAFSI